jgi:4-amino-4-deoxy-L-arabinose transferase-like glycosyltransferase
VEDNFMSSMLLREIKNRFCRREILFLAAVFSVALSLRIFNILSFKAADPSFASALEGTDMNTFEGWAKEILQSGWLDVRNTPPLQAPLYPYFLALLMKIFGSNLLWIKLIQALMGSVSCVLIYVVGKITFNKKAAAAASIMAVFYGMFLYYEAQLLATTLVSFLCLLSILFLMLAREKMKNSYYAAAGACLGLTALAAPNILLFLPPALLWLWLPQASRGTAGKLRAMAVLVGMTAVFVAPVTAKNYFLGGERALISNNGGICFYIGNCRDSSGTLTTTVSMLKIAPHFYQMTPRERAKIDWFDKAAAQIKSDPAGYMGLLFRKSVMFWVGYEIPNNTNYYLSRRFSPVFRFPLLPFWAVAPIALTGVGISARQWRQGLLLLFILCYSLSVIMFFTLSRLRVPIVPSLLVFAGYFTVWFFETIKTRNWRKMALSLISALLIGSFTFITRSGYIRENDYANLGFAYKEQGNCDLAAPEFIHALAVDPYYYPARKALIDCFMAEGEMQRALEESQEAVRLQPYAPQAYKDLAHILERAGDEEGASRNLETASSLNRSLFPQGTGPDHH